MHPRSRLTVRLLATAVLVHAGAELASADRLDKDACQALKSEETSLVGAGVKTDMERGPEWAKSNLSPERMQQIARLIEVGEQIEFRCREIKAPASAKAVQKGKSGAPQTAAVEGAAPPSPGQAPTSASKSAPGPADGEAGTTKIKPKPTVNRAKPAQPPAARRKSPPAAAKVKKSPAGLFSVE